MRLGIVALVFLPVCGLAQKESSTRRIQSIGVVFAPELGYRVLNYASSHEWVEQLRDKTEIWNYGFTAGAKMRLRSKRSWHLETGLLYMNKSFRTNREELLWASADGTFPQSTQTIFQLKYISLPIGVNYPLASVDRLTLSAKAGFAANIFLSAKTKVILRYAGGNENAHASVKQVGHSRFTLAGSIGASLDYKLSDTFMITAEPNYQRFLTSINADNNAKEYLYSFGVGFGASYMF